jgi:hypothetical protein
MVFGYKIVDLLSSDAFLVKKVGSNIFIRVNKKHIKLDTTFLGGEVSCSNTLLSH